MDAGYVDSDGYVFVTARADDVINVAGHRISTSSLEDAVLRHPDVSDVAVFGVPETTKGEVPCCLYIPKLGVEKPAAKLSVEIIKFVREIIGPIASFRLVSPVEALPRTRSGKLLYSNMYNSNNTIILIFQQAKRCVRRWLIWHVADKSYCRPPSRMPASSRTSNGPFRSSAMRWPLQTQFSPYGNNYQCAPTYCIYCFYLVICLAFNSVCVFNIIYI